MASCAGRCAGKPKCCSGISSANGRSVLELIDSNYTFLNERLARCYGIAGVKGDEMRRVIVAAGQSARRSPHAGDRACRDVEPRPDLAGEARAVHSG